MCISRTTSSVQVKVVGPSETLLGVTDIFTCLQSILDSSPEIMSNLDKCDFAVYSTDYSEPGCPAVGHGLFTWILLSASSTAPKPSQNMKDILKARDNNVSLLGIPDERLTMGKVCSDALSLFSSSGTESLEIRITLLPVGSFTQKEYLESLDIYRSLSQFLPSNFDHPAWSRFVSDSNLLEKFMIASREKQQNLPNSKKRPKKQDNILSDKSILDIDTIGNKRELSQSNSDLVKNDEEKFTQVKRRRSTLFHNDEDQEHSEATEFQYHSFIGSPSNSTFYEPDLTLDNLSPTINQPVPVDAYQLPLSVPDLTNLNWPDKSSPASTSPNFQNFSLQSAKITTSISDPNLVPLYSSETSNVDRVVAQGGRKLKNKEKLQKNYLLYCENCGQLESSAWRKSKVVTNGLEQIFRLCNPCGLWLQKKKTLRPRERWEKDRKCVNDNESGKDKRDRKLDGQSSGKSKSNSPLDPERSTELLKNKSPGPTIAEQLALNVSKGRQNKSELSVRTHAMLYRSPESTPQESSTPSTSSSTTENTSISASQLDSSVKRQQSNDKINCTESSSDQRNTYTNGQTPKDSAKTPNTTGSDNLPSKNTGRSKKQRDFQNGFTPRSLIPLIPNHDHTKNPITSIQSFKPRPIKAKPSYSHKSTDIKLKEYKNVQPSQNKKKSSTTNEFSNFVVPSPNTNISEFLSPSVSSDKDITHISSFLSSCKNSNDNVISDIFFDEFLSEHMYSSNGIISSSANTPSKLVDSNSSNLANPKPGAFDELVSELGIYENIDGNHNDSFIESPWPCNEKSNITGNALNVNIEAKARPTYSTSTEPTASNVFDFNGMAEDKADKMTLPSSPPSHYANNEDNWSDDETPIDDS